MKTPLLAAAFVGCICAAHAQWTSINSGVTAKLDAIHFKDAQNGMCSGGFTNALVTTDGGSTWTMSDDQGFRDYGFSDATNGFGASIVGQSMAKTGNGGTSWTQITPPTSNSLWAVASTSATTGHFVGTGGVYWRTTNGGASVTVGSSGTTDLLTDIVFTSTSVGYIAVQTGDIKKTTNGGLSWTTVYSAPNPTLLTEMCFPDANTGYAVGSTGGVFKTADGGTTWQQQTAGTSTMYFQGVNFYDANHGIIVGMNGVIFYTADGGTTWNQQNSGTTQALYDVRMLSATSAVVTGDGGVILKNTNITATVGTSEMTDAFEVNVAPNPVNDLLTISAATPFTGVEVYDAQGKQVFVSGTQALDTYTVDFSGLESGVYIVLINDPRKQESIKVIH